MQFDTTPQQNEQNIGSKNWFQKLVQTLVQKLVPNIGPNFAAFETDFCSHCPFNEISYYTLPLPLLQKWMYALTNDFLKKTFMNQIFLGIT